MRPEPSPEYNPRWPTRRPQRNCSLCRWERFPPGSVEGRSPCPSCGVTTCVDCATPCKGCELVAQLRDVRDGRFILGRDAAHAAAKTLHIVRTVGDARDVLIAPDRIVVRALDDARLHSYYPHPGPAVLATILRDAGVAGLTEAVVARDPGSPERKSSGPAPIEQLAWLLPLERGVEIRFRPVPASGAPRTPIAIPAEGPWALPPPWTPPTIREVRVAVDGRDVACPHCGVASESYRALDRAFVCGACGRSFGDAHLAVRPRRPE